MFLLKKLNLEYIKLYLVLIIIMSNNYDILDDENTKLEVEKVNNNNFFKNLGNKIYYRLFKKKNKKEYFVLTIIVHLIFHILLLSILESIFFFKYASVIETQSYLNSLRTTLKEIKNIDIENNLYYKDDYNKIKLNITQLYYDNYNDENLINYFEYLKNESYNGKQYRIKRNEELYYNSFYACYVLGSVFLTFLFFVKYYFKLGFKKLFIEHIFFLLGIGLYEFWFFYNIVIKYILLSSEETNYIINSCIYNYFNTKNQIFKYNIDCNI